MTVAAHRPGRGGAAVEAAGAACDVVRVKLSRVPITRSIRTKLPAAIGLLWLIGLLALAWMARSQLVRTERAAADAHLANVSLQLANLLQGQAQQAIAELRPVASAPALRDYLRESAAAELAETPGAPESEAPARQELAQQFATTRRFAGAELWDSRGTRLLTIGPASATLDRTDERVLVAAARAAESGAVGPLAPLGDSLALPAVVPVTGGGRILGYLAHWEYAGNSREERQRIVELVGPGSGLFIGSPGSGAPWTDFHGVVAPPPTAPAGPDGVMQYVRPGVGPVLGFARAVPHTPWTLLVELSEPRVYAPVGSFFSRFAAVAALVFLLGVAGAWLVTRRMTRRLEQLTEGAESVSAVPGVPAGPPSGGDELTRLGTAFSRMATRVEETHHQLELKVAELRASQEQFAHAQRMEAVGRLAGGVAHDFNNLLTVILGGVELARQETGPAADRTLNDVREAGERAAVLTRQLLAFSRRQVTTPTVMDVNQLVGGLESMLGRLIGERVRVVARPGGGAMTVRADRGQLEQVLVNLVINARDAMPEGGTIIIETETVTLSEEYARTREDTTPGEYVALAVSDTGTGMTDEVKQHLFEPFFTTKEHGRGSGLGLATCYGIVKQSGGHIAAYSELGVGTTMRVYLPLVHEAADAAIRPAPAGQGGDETILLVEDEPEVRRVGARMLRGRGYRVLEAPDGEAALALIATYAETIHLLLTDVVLPGLGGRELAERVTRERPAIRVLFASGYTDDVVLQHQLVTDAVAFIEKPFTAAALGRKVRDVLDTA